MEKDVKTQITERWFRCLDHLIYIGKCLSYVDFEKETGITNQRVADIKRFLTRGGRPSFVSVENVHTLVTEYDCSLEFIMLGTGPMLLQGDEKGVVHISPVRDDVDAQKEIKKLENKLMSYKMDLETMNQKLKLLEDTVFG